MKRWVFAVGSALILWAAALALIGRLADGVEWLMSRAKR